MNRLKAQIFNRFSMEDVVSKYVEFLHLVLKVFESKLGFYLIWVISILLAASFEGL